MNCCVVQRQNNLSKDWGVEKSVLLAPLKTPLLHYFLTLPYSKFLYNTLPVDKLTELFEKVDDEQCSVKECVYVMHFQMQQLNSWKQDTEFIRGEKRSAN